MRLGSLFAGIGGFDYAAQQLGWTTAWVSEVDPWCNAVLKKHWPDVPNLGDITAIDFSQAPAIDVLCGGFPCQDISSAGKGAGITGARSGLWSHYARAIEALRPKWVLIENVSILRRRGLDRVLRDLDALGYDAEWHCVPASAVGAPHQRDRIWIVAYPRSVSAADRERPVHGQAGEHPAEAGVDAQRDAATGGAALGDSEPAGLQGCPGLRDTRTGRPNVEPAAGAEGLRVPQGDTDHPRLEGLGRLLERAHEWSAWTNGEAVRGYDGSTRLVAPGVPLLAHGLPGRVGQLRAYGNAIVPQVALLFFHAIQEYEATCAAA
jgi:DNA (cytosine-5)-methyltransferase 1